MKHLHRLAGVALAVTLALPLAATAQAPERLQGEVLEVLNVEGYTYLRLKTRGGETWAAVPTVSVAKGAQVGIDHPMPMDNFESKSLKRRFDRVYFGSIAGDGAKAAPGGPPPAMHGNMSSGIAEAMHRPGNAARVEPVAKAGGAEGRTVAEAVQGRATLKDRTVLIRARVVKVNNDIMGKNWLHLQDGSGKAQDGSHDILVTSTDSAAVGDIVTARGTLRTDVTLGPGYAYAVMVENASVKKQ